MPSTVEPTRSSAKSFAKGAFSILAKLVLSCVVVLVLFIVLQLVFRGEVMLSSALVHPSQPSSQTSTSSKQPSGSAQFPVDWPHLPGSIAVSRHQTTINGIQTCAEEWRTGAPASDVIAYYKAQMLPRGWKDATEDAFHIEPSHHTLGGDVLETPNFVQTYRSVLESSLVLTRPPWSIHLNTAPSSDPLRPTAVRVYVAATLSLEELVHPLASSPSEPGQPDAAPLETVRYEGGRRVRASIAVKRKAPEPALQEALADFRARNWSVMAVAPRKGSSAGFLAWLTKGDSYAAISAAPLPEKRALSSSASSVTIVESTPDQNKAH